MSNMAARFTDVLSRIAAASTRSGGQDVNLVAVTKTVPTDMIREAFALGHRTFGENRVQEALQKADALPQADWHFIGRLQTNKVKDVVGRFSLIHSLDRWKLARALQDEAEAQGVTVRVLVQVNVAGEKQKGGIEPVQLPDFLNEASSLSCLSVVGLMAIPPYCEDPEDARPYFREMRRLFDCSRITQGMEILSMGMSGDFEVAVEEGSNLVRVGSALFGERY
jgi:pyridoxal phosphate enzyme (YggS family)